jgi:hypothetical protein
MQNITMFCVESHGFITAFFSFEKQISLYIGLYPKGILTKQNM